MSASRRIVVVGAGLAADRVVKELFRRESTDSIIVVGAEACPPYDRPPLTKQFLASGARSPWLSEDLPPPEGRVRYLQGCRALRLDTHGKLLTTTVGDLPYDELVIATGSSPRRIPGIGGRGTHVMRTIDDALALRAEMLLHGRVVIVGGGFIGTEVAATARSMGIEVTLVEAAGAPLAPVVGKGPSIEIARLHLDSGVDLRCGTSVVESLFEGNQRVVRLSDGSELSAPVLLHAVGAEPSVDWLAGSGVELDDGIVCDGQGRTSVPQVWAAGDVARWWEPLVKAHARIEHWTSAGEQGATVAAALMGSDHACDPVPYFWSDQYGRKIQMIGFATGNDDIEMLWVGPQHDKLLAVYGRGGRATAVLGIQAMRQVARLRPLLAAGASQDEIVRAALT